jgi:hypothetical protein
MVGMLEENPLHPLVLALGDFEVVWRIQVKKRNGFSRAVDVERACMDDLVSTSPSLLCPKSIEFDSAPKTLHASGNSSESVAFADAWIERHETGHHLKMPPDSFSFRQWKRVIPETQSSFDSQGGNSFLRFIWDFQGRGI